MKYLGISLFVALVYGSSSTAAVEHPTELVPVKLMTQTFLTDGASVISIDDRQSCHNFRAIDVRASQYISADGLHVAFADVERSPAAGLWIIGAANRKRVSSQLPIDTIRENRVWRVVLKYPVESLEMESGGVRRDLSGRLDAAGDSVTLSKKDREELQSAWRDARDVKLIGRSLDTGREVIDTLLPIHESDLLACDDFERATSHDIIKALNDVRPLAIDLMSVTLPWSLYASSFEVEDIGLNGKTVTFDPSQHRLGQNGPISVHWEERLPGAPKEARLTGCRMTDLGGKIERYRLAEVTGFVAQSGEAWITRDDAGEVQQVYIPGVFEALRKHGSEKWIADVSVSAFANNPFEEPIYKGCLGSQAIQMAGGADLVFEAPAKKAIASAFDPSSRFKSMPFGLNTFNGNGSSAEYYGGLQTSGGATSVVAPDNVKNPVEIASIGKQVLAQPSPVSLPGSIWLYLVCFTLLGLVGIRHKSGQSV